MSNTISNTDDIIDSRDVIERIEELTAERDEVIGEKSMEEWAAESGEELAALEALAEEAEGYASDWHHGATLIRDSYFEQYAQDMAEDMYGDKIRNAEWPFSRIDWEKAADDLKNDYTLVSFDGSDYWIR